MGAIIASRGPVDPGVGKVLEALPLAIGDTFALSVCPRRWFGGFASAVISEARQRAADLVVVAQEGPKAGALRRLAADGIRICEHIPMPVLLLPAEHSAPAGGRVVVSAVAHGEAPVAAGTPLRRLLDLAGAEAVVASIARPFFPPFSRIAVGMRACQMKALREVWEKQASDAATEAAMIVDQLPSGGARPLYLGRTGRFVDEVREIAQSGETSLVCVLFDPCARKWLGRSMLADLLRSVNVPLLLAP